MMQIDKTYLKKRFWKIFARSISYFLFEGRPLTTRGRWINPIVFLNYKILSTIPISGPKNHPIFIVGTGRSGTTILGKILSMHKQVAFLNEPKALWFFTNKEDDLIGSYSDRKGRYYFNENDFSVEAKKKMDRIYRSYLLLTFSNFIVDKYPEQLFRYHYIKKIYPNAKFIFLVRNGEDVVSSISFWSKKYPKSKNESWWGLNDKKWILLCEQVIKKDKYFKDLLPILKNLNSNYDRAAIEWIVTMRYGLELSKNYTEDFLTIRYENLINNSKQELLNLQKFIGLKNDQRFYDYAKIVLKENQKTTNVILNEKILKLFKETMITLNYQNI